MGSLQPWPLPSVAYRPLSPSAPSSPPTVGLSGGVLGGPHCLVWPRGPLGCRVRSRLDPCSMCSPGCCHPLPGVCGAWAAAGVPTTSTSTWAANASPVHFQNPVLPTCPLICLTPDLSRPPLLCVAVWSLLKCLRSRAAAPVFSLLLAFGSWRGRVGGSVQGWANVLCKSLARYLRPCGPHASVTAT